MIDLEDMQEYGSGYEDETRNEVRFFRPSIPLRPYVRYYYVLTAVKGMSVLTFPLGCPQIIFHRRSPLFIPELETSQNVFTISGQVNFPSHVSSRDDVEMIVVVFYPHTAGMFIGVSPYSFYNLEISGYDLGDRALTELGRRISECGDTDACVRMADQWLLKRLHGEACDTSRLGAAVNLLMSMPSATVGELAEAVGLGKRQFERVFATQVGMPPKEFSRIVRFQRALWLMQNGLHDGAQTAYACGYSDQSHFIREFKVFSGYTPATIWNACTPYSDLFSRWV